MPPPPPPPPPSPYGQPYYPPLPPAPLPPSPPPRRGGLGCFAKGCIVLLVLGLLFGGLLGAGAYYLVRTVRGYTADHAEPVPVSDATSAQVAEVVTRAQAFSDAVGRGERATLTLSAADLNAVIARDERYRDLRGRVFFAIVRDELHARVSVPLDGIPGFKGRWFNGEAGLDVRFADGELTLRPLSLEANGQRVSRQTLRAMSTPEAMQQLNQGFRDRVRRDPKLEAAIRKLESVDLKDDKLVIVADGSEGANADAEKDEGKT